MNVIVSNKYKEMLSTLEIDIIKAIDGEFEVDELINMFSNFFFQRMILDITAIKNFKEIKNLQKLSISLDMSKVILLLDDDEESSSSIYLSRLISMGIYNFTRNKEGIMYLLEHPNSYRDVAHIHQLEELKEVVTEKVVSKGLKVLGIKSLTAHAGATSLIYMLKKQLELNYTVLAVEVDKRDFLYFNAENMISVTEGQLADVILQNKHFDVILIDLNESQNESACNDVLYLLEPSSIRLNRLMRRNRRVFEQMAGKKLILNQSLLNSKDVLDFENEAKTQVFYNLPPLNDRSYNKVLDGLLGKLGFGRQKTENVENKNKILGLFKF